MKHDDEAFEQQIRSALDNSVENLDAETRSRLTAMRSAALEHKSFSIRRLLFGNWIPATAVAASVVITIALVGSPFSEENRNQLVLQDTDVALELLINEDLQEEAGDPTFYVWLDSVLLEEEEGENAS